ncbi:hypothetical protein [Roseibium aggregatum]|uniref:Lysozyme inhibitor LprI N-terminal domain-containing protein n=1 Tax=Roseibium aggregatum TaxID=187304 RepID=A0A926P338_9HYPH|nr:hypothetical protein [Roseibium aggregatum]MBD1549271.1 hypothetical protein [Roseibium aggregatum]
MLRPFALCALFMTFAAGSHAETPQTLWNSIPPLPNSAETAKCGESDSISVKIENAAARALTDAQLALAKVTPAAVTDEQGKAIEQLMDYSLQECAFNAETEVWQIVQSAREQVSAAMTDLEARRIGALDACGSEMSPGYPACYSRTRIEYQAMARDTANHYLDLIGGAYADWRERINACLGRREAALARFDKAGVIGPFAAQGLNVRTQTWMLVGLHAQTSRELCNIVDEAAHAMDID